jgi:predicted AlkP superfamily phosphohydrolase/phosphomutase
VGDVLFAAAQAGLTLKADMTKDTLKAYPAARLTAELATAIKEHKADIIQVRREDEEMQRTGVIQSKRQVFEMAREYFDPDNPKGIT